MTGFIFAVIAIIVLTPWILKKLSAGKWEITVLQVINNWRSLKGADINLTDSDLFISLRTWAENNSSYFMTRKNIKTRLPQK